MISIVIPAHNESALIETTLAAMLDGAEPGELEIIVVCNGCSDNTAELCRGVGEPVQVIETDVPSKSNALNLGDELASGFPRFFVDADVTLTIGAIRDVVEALSREPILAAAPRLRVDLEGRPWTVKAYYGVWMRLPYVDEGMLGCGVYAMSERGRSRFEGFPDIIADDHFIHLLFSEDERCTLPSTYFSIRAPRRLWDLIQIDVRRRVGVFELENSYPGVQEQVARDRAKQRKALLRLLMRPHLWAQLSVYVFAKTLTAALHRIKAAQKRDKEWLRDDSSRLRSG